MDQDSLLIAGLAAAGVGALFYVFVYPLLSGEAKAEKRVQALSQSSQQRRSAERLNEAAATRKKSVAESLKELDENEAAKRRVSLQERIEQAGLSMPAKTFITGSAVPIIVQFTRSLECRICKPGTELKLEEVR